MAQTCTNCGYFDDTNANGCPMCGRSFQQKELPSSTNTEVHRQTETESTVFQPHQNEVHAPDIQTQQGLEGRITLVQRVEERIPRNLYRSLSRALILALLSPIYLSLFFISFCLFLAFAIIGFSTLAQFFNPLTWTATLLEFFEVLVLRRFGVPDNIVIYRGEVRDDENRTSAFTMYGYLVTGNFVEGHRVRFEGEWRRVRGIDPNSRGTFYVNSGYDLDTSSSITSSYRNPWRTVFYCLLSLMTGAVGLGWYYISTTYQQFF